MKPSVSIVMAVYNGERYLKEAILSILNQSFKDFEFIIIDDGSTDGTPDIIKSFKDSRIKLTTHKDNKKLIYSLNEGVKKAQGEFIARMDADDVSHSDRIKIQHNFLKCNPRVKLVGTAAEIMDQGNNDVAKEQTFTNHQVIKRALAVTNCFVHGSVMFDKELFFKIGGYRKSAYLIEDYDLWTRFVSKRQVANINTALYKWRLNPRGESLSKQDLQNEAFQKAADNYWRTFGSAGPAPRNMWGKIWATRPLTRKMTELHILFGKGYLWRNKRILALQHFLAAIQQEGNFLPAYFYPISFFLPKKLFFFLEHVLLTMFRRARGY